MKYLFVLGRNPELSKAEIFSYFERENIQVKNSQTISNGLLVEIAEEKIDLKKILSELGGTIAAGKVLLSGKIDSLASELEKKPVYFGRDNKVIYSVLNFAHYDDLSIILDAIKTNFK